MIFEEFKALFEVPDRTRKRYTYGEDNMQMACVKWFDMQYPDLSLLLYHTANEGKVSKTQAGRRKRMGVRAGVADLILQIPRHGYSYLALELKMKGNYQSENQKKWQKLCEDNGGKYVVIRSTAQFIDTINEYLCQ